MGTVDELNSFIGLLLAETLETETRIKLEDIQHDLFDLGGDLCIPGRITINAGQVERLEAQLDYYNGALPALREFILPGGTRAASLCHVARAVCRRAERRLVELYQNETLVPVHLKYLNRLSDFLFVLCRSLNREQGVEDVMWQPGKTTG
jgi:cob(I)alamin adenosyltransferase